MKITKFLLALGLILLSISPLYASPWGRKVGELFFAPQVYYYTTNHYWDAEGDRKKLENTFRKLEIATYFEWGVHPETTLTVRVPYQHLKSGNDSSSGLADVELGLLKRINTGKNHVVSLQAKSIIPTGYSIDKNLRLGYGRLGLETSILAGYGKNSAFLEGGIGYRYYFGYPSDQIRGYFRAGFKQRNLLIMDTVDVQYGINNGEQKEVGDNITLNPYYRLIQNDFNFTFKIRKGIYLSAGVIKAVWGRNTGDGINVYSQLWFLF